MSKDVRLLPAAASRNSRISQVGGADSSDGNISGNRRNLAGGNADHGCDSFAGSTSGEHVENGLPLLAELSAFPLSPLSALPRFHRAEQSTPAEGIC